MKYLLLFLALMFFGGCASSVKPWQKGTLAKATMQPDGGNALRVKFNEHIFVSKEGVKGGNGVSGGGCGCK
jgi:hypothetical protein